MLKVREKLDILKIAVSVCAVCSSVALIVFNTMLIKDPSKVRTARAARDELDEQERLIRDQHRESLRKTLDAVKGFDAAKFCSIDDPSSRSKSIDWKVDEAEMHAWIFNFTAGEDKCESVRQKLSFFRAPLTKEEADYPLAYGMLVYKNSAQVYTMLSAFYQPQNVYMLGIDEKATTEFRDEMTLLAQCFPNVYLVYVGHVHWCQSSVLNAVFRIFRYLAAMSHQWQYFQYLSGVDLPLKTNLEMVRIFKQLNGTVNADVIRHNHQRTSMVKKPCLLPLWKSSMSALIPREAANHIATNEITSEFIDWLQPTDCPDETFWTTIAGNPQVLKVPGGFDAQAVCDKIVTERDQLRQTLPHEWLREHPAGTKTLAEPFELFSYYISRYQVWDVDNLPCRGQFSAESCVFGIGDLPELLRRPELVAHKFYWGFDPAVYFCVYKAIRERALDYESQTAFRGDNYRQLPFVRMAAGESAQNMSFHLNAYPNFHFS